MPDRLVRGLVGAAVLAAAFAACGGNSGAPRTAPVSVPDDESISLGIDGAWSVAVDPADRLIRDARGSYFCVLKRPDDLAGLRAQFNSRNER